MIKITNEEYLGDGLYVGHDGYHVIIAANDKCNGQPTDVVYLDENVTINLIRYLKKLRLCK